MKAVKLTKLVQEMNLKNLTPEVDMEHVRITLPDINRPALQLTGYFEHFASERVQIIGYVEYTYLMHLNPEERKRSFENFVSKQIPCVIFTTMTEPDEDMLRLAKKYEVPIFVTKVTTSDFMAEIIRASRVALDIDAFDERLHLDLMDALVKSGRNNESLQQYRHATHMYYRYLGSQPPAGIQEFYKQIITAGNELEMNIDIIRRELSEMGGVTGAFVCE